MERKKKACYPGTLNNQFYGCFNWMIQNLYMGNGWKSPFPYIYKWLALEFQDDVIWIL